MSLTKPLSGSATIADKITLSRLSLHEQVADILREMIVTRKLKPGEQVRIAELSHRLGVSLTPLREALKILAEESLVELTPNRPTRIVQVTGRETQALFEVMAGMESLAAELASARMTASELVNLERLHEKMQRRHSENARDAYFALNREIHDLIVEYARNPVLTHTRSKMAPRAERVRLLAVKNGSRRDEAMQEHEAVMQAFRNRAPDDARRTWRKHMLNSGEEICRVLQLQDTDPE